MNAAQPFEYFKRKSIGASICKGALGCVLLVVQALSLPLHAQTATGTTGIDATGNSQSELAACNNGTTQQSRESCVAEVQNAQAAKRAGQLGNADSQLDTNALQRCNVLQGEDKIACQARVDGYGTISGGVAAGGTLRQIETVVVPKDATDLKVEPKTNSDIIMVVPAPR